MSRPRRTTRLQPEIAPLTPMPPEPSELDLLKENYSLRRQLRRLEHMLFEIRDSIALIGQPLVPSPKRKR